MAQQARQVGRIGGGSVRGGKQMSEEELAQQGQGEAKRQLSKQGQVGGAVGRGRSLGSVRRLGKGLGNRSLGRFRRPQ